MTQEPRRFPMSLHTRLFIKRKIANSTLLKLGLLILRKNHLDLYNKLIKVGLQMFKKYPSHNRLITLLVIKILVLIKVLAELIVLKNQANFR